MRNNDHSSSTQTTGPDRLNGTDASPFFLRGAGPGCLLVHGFSGTPQEMRFLGDRLHTRGYTVNGVRLAGHCTSIDDFERTTWHDWYGSACAGVEALREDTPNVVVIGQSMGALLALKLAVEYPQVVAGLVLLSPALLLSNPWVHRIGPALPLLRPLLRGRGRLRRGERDVADRQARTESPSYREVPLLSLHQLLVLQKHVRGILPQVRQPALIIHSHQDHTCPPINVSLLEGSLSGRIRSVLLDDSFHVVSIDVDKERVATEVAAFIGSIRSALP